jgi:glycosyltransferase involved in cell wall biosynthesis
MELVNPRTGDDIHSSLFPDSQDPSFPLPWGFGPEHSIADGVVVIIPAYDQELVIASMVLKVRMYLNHVIVVDYGSEDLTAELARAAGAEVIALPGCTEIPFLLMKGIHRAKEMNCPAVLMIDAENGFYPGDLLRVARQVFSGEADLVIGMPSRRHRAPGHAAVTDRPGILTGLGFLNEKDVKYPEFFAFNQMVAGLLDLKPNGSDFWKHALSDLTEQDLSIRTIRLSEPFRTTQPGGDPPTGRPFRGILRNFEEIGAKKPLILFSAIGCAVLLVGVTGGYLAIEEYADTAKIHGLLAFASMVAMLGGLLLINSGLILNSLIKTTKKTD